MSIILKAPEAMKLNEGDVLLFCKGADGVIYDRLKEEGSYESKKITTNHLEGFANEGIIV
jgi:phospholipid-translocating ATPase